LSLGRRRGVWAGEPYGLCLLLLRLLQLRRLRLRLLQRLRRGCRLGTLGLVSEIIRLAPPLWVDRQVPPPRRERRHPHSVGWRSPRRRLPASKRGQH
jgi:hypothetical protein